MKNQVIPSIAFLFLLFIFNSCSNDTGTQDSQDLNLRTQDNVAFILEAAEKIREDVEGNRNPLPNFSSQAELDTYLVMIGEQPGSVSLSFFNQVLATIGMAERDGMSNFLGDQPYSDFTKTVLLNNSEGSVTPALNLHPEYLNLDISEKETILLSNMLIDNLPPDINANGCYVAVATGISIGNLICGPNCGIAGGIVGVVYCFWVKHHQQ